MNKEEFNKENSRLLINSLAFLIVGTIITIINIVYRKNSYEYMYLSLFLFVLGFVYYFYNKYKMMKKYNTEVKNENQNEMSVL